MDTVDKVNVLAKLDALGKISPRVFCGKTVVAEKVANACASYARSISASDVVLLHDAAVFRSGKKGLVTSLDSLALSSDANKQPQARKWSQITWIGLSDQIILLDDIEYSLGRAELIEPLDLIHGLQRNRAFYSRPDVLIVMLKSLLSCQLIPVTLFADKPTILGSNIPDFADSAERLLAKLLDRWIAADARKPILRSLSKENNPVLKELDTLRTSYAVFLGAWNKGLQKPTHPSSLLWEAFARAWGAISSVTSLMAGQWQIAVLHAKIMIEGPQKPIISINNAFDFVMGRSGKAPSKQMMEAWSIFHQELSSCKKRMIPLLNEQVQFCIDTVGELRHLFPETTRPELYAHCSWPLGQCSPIVLCNRLDGALPLQFNSTRGNLLFIRYDKELTSIISDLELLPYQRKVRLPNVSKS